MQDLTIAGALIVEAGQHVLCDIIFSFKEGRMQCEVLQPGV
jgi:hypothetical protein